jgi:hypothetical protein
MIRDEKKTATTRERRRLGELLRRVADGEISADEALRETDAWTSFPWKDRDVSRGYEGLQHFYSDADIRAREPSYAAAEIAGLRRLADALLRYSE